jgi:hypothetical protein
MSQKNLSTVATDVIATYGITATNVINSYRFGGERVAGFVDQRFAAAVNRGAAALRHDLRANLIDSQQRVTGYYVKSIHLGTDKAENAVGVAVDLATKGVSLLAENAERFDRAINVNALASLSRAAVPAAELVDKVAERIEEGSSELVRRVSGKDMPAKALATIKLKAATSEATANRKRVTKAATKKVSTIVAEAADETSNAARRVARKIQTTGEQAINAAAETANDTANVARSAARKIKSAGDQVVSAVADTATETSNVARRVSRKAKATGKAA